jgi:phytoene synthase
MGETCNRGWTAAARSRKEQGVSLSRPSLWAEPRVPPGEATALLAKLRSHASLPETLQFGTPDRPPLHLNEAYRACEALTRKHSRSFFLSTQLLPAEKRRAIRALYAFCRTSDDLVDQPGQDIARALAKWVALVHAPHAPPDNAVLLAWHDTVARYGVPQALVDELLAGVAMDLSFSRYATFDELWRYCYRVASVVGLISMQIIGGQPGAESYAITLGVALQLTNILRDVGEDAARGRIYLPQEDLARFGVHEDELLAGCREPVAWKSDARFRALMSYEIRRAHTLYEAAWPGIAMLNSDGQLAVAVAAEIYRGILARIVANDYDVFARRAHVSLPGKLLMLPRIWRRLRAKNRELRTTQRVPDREL